MLYFNDPNLTIYNADVLAGLALLADKSVHCAITSPPYWGLRDYGIPPTDWPAITFIPVAGLPPITIPAMSAVHGLEPGPWSYVAHAVHIFRQVHRVLRDDGTLWLNLGDCYAGSGKAQGHKPEHTNMGKILSDRPCDIQQWISVPSGLKSKDLVGIPWMVAKALQADGWYLRQGIIWAKKNCMPESVNDRPTTSHEYIFLLSKSQRYYYDAEAVKEASGEQTGMAADFKRESKDHVIPKQSAKQHRAEREPTENTGSRNLRSVWHMATQPYPEAHFATFPSQLPETCIKAGTSERGVCAKCGAGWTRVVEKGNLIADNGYENTHRIGKKNFKADGDVRGSDMLNRGIQPNQHFENTTTGWIPGCKCNADTVPATVLEPFAGSGTTNAMAERLGRRSIALEIKKEYCALILKRSHHIKII